MKKISLLLALLLVATCCMLASCGEEETSSAPEVSSQAPATSSEAPATSSEAEPESSEEAPESSEEESKEPEYVKNPDAVSTEGNNVAEGKTYTRSLLYRQGGEDVSWGWDENAAIAYPDDANDLTDGVIAADDAAYSDAAWMGFHLNCPDYAENGGAWFIVDLEQSYQLSELTLYTGSIFLGSGIAAPTNVEFLVSEDGENWYSVGSVVPTTDETVANAPATIECDVTGRYVKVVMQTPGWAFVSEFTAK
ncbi:MAG: discoidin domain-containing protein [Clostridia bacterium]|nr:discoidin domain-containing protein [Clostridia bacterium]